ncbi:Hypothetical protein A7982_10488 [Minicystis rosea]|nr:Hypothetical protein A7982_10488 [Minicystis rosea]
MVDLRAKSARRGAAHGRFLRRGIASVVVCSSLGAVVSTARAESPAEAPIDCSQPGPDRVPLFLDVGGRSVQLQADSFPLPEAPGREPKSRRWLGTRCLDTPGKPGINCEGSCTLYVRPGKYHVAWGTNEAHALLVDPGGIRAKLREGNTAAAVTGLAFLGLGLGGMLISTMALLLKEQPPSFTPYVAAFGASVGAAGLGFALMSVFVPGFKRQPYRAAGATSAITFSAAPLPGGGWLGGTVHF